MIAYKAFEVDLRDRQGNTYEIDKWYTEKNAGNYVPSHGRCYDNG